METPEDFRRNLVEADENYQERRRSPRPVTPDGSYTAEGVGPDSDHRIRQRAQELYEARGRQEGRDLDDWLQAEREVGHGAEPESRSDQEARDRR
jgi:hypothetical protein